MADRRTGTWIGVVLFATLIAPAKAETLKFESSHAGRPLPMPAELVLPPGQGRVPAMIVVHGSGGVVRAHTRHYVDSITSLGVAAVALDSYGPRGVGSTVRDQLSVTSTDMIRDVAGAFKALSVHPRIDADRIGIVGFSKGGIVAMHTAVESLMRDQLPPSRRLRLHVAYYPGCTLQYRDLRTSGAPIHLLLGGSDDYTGVVPCAVYMEKFRNAGARLSHTVYPGALHGWDAPGSFSDPRGQNFADCIIEEMEDGSWMERKSGLRAASPLSLFQRASPLCMKLGIRGGPSKKTFKQSTEDLKSLIRLHLLSSR